jgi:hypothetical protein
LLISRAKVTKLTAFAALAMWSLLTAVSAPAQAVTPVRIMCVGDGVKVGYTDNPNWTIPFQFGYRGGLYTRLQTNSYAVQFVGASTEPWDGTFGLPTNTPSPDLRTLAQDHHRGYAGLGTAAALANIGPWLMADNRRVFSLRSHPPMFMWSLCQFAHDVRESRCADRTPIGIPLCVPRLSMIFVNLVPLTGRSTISLPS